MGMKTNRLGQGHAGHTRPMGQAAAGLTPARRWLLGGASLLVLLALLGPRVSDFAHQHDFVDQRMAWGIPHAMDVLSNAPFALLGVWILALVYAANQRIAGLGAAYAGTSAHAQAGRLARAWPAWRDAVVVFGVGLLCTFVGSGYYHWQPDNAGLLWDRMGMAVAFAGMLSLVVCDRVDAKAGRAVLYSLGLLAPAAVLWWAHSHNVWPWAVVQLGGVLAIAVMAWAPRHDKAMPALNVWAVIACYAVAKVTEGADGWIFAATQQWISGHTIKHVMAAAAAVPVLLALRHWPAQLGGRA